jgi:hypothetical protein
MKRLRQYGNALNATIKARAATNLAKSTKKARPAIARQLGREAKLAGQEAKQLARKARRGR